MLYSFGAPPDGSTPNAGVIGGNGTFYGTTEWGGKYGYGTVFSITTGGVEKVLHSFGYGTDGSGPWAGLRAVKGVLYGTTIAGGAYGTPYGKGGTVFSITTDGTEKVLHSFGDGSDGALPQAGLINVRGTLYGTTCEGGRSGHGTVFSLTSTGKESVLHSFGGSPDGAGPQAGLIKVNGTLYGTTFSGGTYYSSGTVFSITRGGLEKVLHSFNGYPDGSQPSAGLAQINGTLYGTTLRGGANKCFLPNSETTCGTVFSIAPDGVEKVLHSFGKGYDGWAPGAALTAVKGELYGTTSLGGTSDACPMVGFGYISCGTVFSITTGGTEAVLHSFDYTDGGWLSAGLHYNRGRLFGTAWFGGTSGYGTIFSLTP